MKLLGSPVPLFLALRRLMNGLGYSNYIDSHTQCITKFYVCVCDIFKK